MSEVRICDVSAEQMREDLDLMVAIYCVAMGYSARAGVVRRPQMTRETTLEGFRAVGARDVSDQLVGFGYGYTGRPGQWWHDQVSGALSETDAAVWTGSCFELCELHLLPGFHGRGLGRGMLELLLSGCPQQTVLLSALEVPGRAWNLYRAAGFLDILRHFHFPGDPNEFAVLGRPLPLGAADTRAPAAT